MINYLFIYLLLSVSRGVGARRAVGAGTVSLRGRRLCFATLWSQRWHRPRFAASALPEKSGEKPFSPRNSKSAYCRAAVREAGDDYYRRPLVDGYDGDKKKSAWDDATHTLRVRMDSKVEGCHLSHCGQLWVSGHYQSAEMIGLECIDVVDV